ncbi:hypothetical protein [Butyricimonas virosa]
MRDRKFERGSIWIMVMAVITFIIHVVATFTVYPRSARLEFIAVIIFIMILLLSKKR